MNLCVCCGKEVPEGRMVCIECELSSKALTPKSKKLMNMANEVCAEYCKYPDEYSSLYCDDPEEAEERLAIEKCENCPIAKMMVEVNAV